MEKDEKEHTAEKVSKPRATKEAATAVKTPAATTAAAKKRTSSATTATKSAAAKSATAAAAKATVAATKTSAAKTASSVTTAAKSPTVSTSPSATNSNSAVVSSAKSPTAAARMTAATRTSSAVRATTISGASVEAAKADDAAVTKQPARTPKTTESTRTASQRTTAAVPPKDTLEASAAKDSGTLLGEISEKPPAAAGENVLAKSEVDSGVSSHGDKDEKKKKGVVVAIVIAIIILLLLLGFLVARGVWLGGGDSAHSAKARENTLALAQKYIDKGQYDDAMRLLDALLQADINDKDADELLDKAIELKKQNQGDGGNVVVQPSDPSSYNINIDTNEITNALREQNERNQETINRLLAEQQRRNDEILSARQEEQALQQKAAEEQRKKEETERKRKEEELAQANKAVKEKMDAINEKILAGKADLNTGNIDSALNTFSAAVSELPLEQGEPEFSALKYSELASTLYDAAQNEKDPERKEKLNNAAIQYVNKSLSVNPNDPASHYIMGMNYIDDGNWESAQKELAAAVKNDPNNYLYYYNLGRAQFRLGNFAQARSSFETTVKLKRDFDPAHFNLGMTCQRLKLNKDALAAFRSAHQVNPNYSRAYLEEARILNSAFNDSKGALAAYDEVIRLDPVNTQALNECGLVYAGLGQYEKAENYHRRAVALLRPGDKDPVTYYNLATALFNQNKISDAETNAKTAYEQMDALKRNSDKVMIVYNYALIEDSLGKADSAITLYKEVLILDPANSKTKTNLGVMFMNMNPPDADTALTFFLDAYKSNPSFELENNLGSAYLVKKDYDNAITYFQNAIKKSPKDNTVRFNLAQAYSGAGDFNNAKTTYLEILNADTSNWDTYIEVAKVFIALKDTANAEAYLKILQQKNPTYKKAEVDALLAAAAHNF